STVGALCDGARFAVSRIPTLGRQDTCRARSVAPGPRVEKAGGRSMYRWGARVKSEKEEMMEMRVLVLAKESERSEQPTPPTEEAMAAYQKFNAELVKSGVVLAAGRLHPSAQGKRVRFEGKTRTVLDGPFTETKEFVGGYWLWQVRSMDGALDLIRRRATLARKHEEIAREVQRMGTTVDLDASIDEHMGDDLLGLIFMACHPVLSNDARVALTLRVLGGLTTAEIARAFLVP